MHTSSDIRNPIVEADIPCVGIGCLGGDLSQNDQHDEWVDVVDFQRMVDVTTAIVTDWCSGFAPTKE
jgi:acetylornithine deacetylase